MPPTEKRGRVQTSTITVAAMRDDIQTEFQIDRSEVERQYTCSGGKGGQHVNRRSTCVILKHIPTGIIVRSEEHRTQGKNEEAAWERLRQKLSEIQARAAYDKTRNDRLEQIGFGGRNDKRRTYRIQDGYVVDHVSNKKITVKELYKGNIKGLHK